MKMWLDSWDGLLLSPRFRRAGHKKRTAARRRALGRYYYDLLRPPARRPDSRQPDRPTALISNWKKKTPIRPVISFIRKKLKSIIEALPDTRRTSTMKLSRSNSFDTMAAVSSLLGLVASSPADPASPPPRQLADTRRTDASGISLVSASVS